MNALSIILNIVLILISIVLIGVVLMQQGQRQGLGAISGGAETFFGKGKSKGLDAKLQKITKIAAVAFIILAIATTMVVSHIASEEVVLTSEAAEIEATAETEAAAEDAVEAPVEEAVEAPAEEAAQAE